MWEYSQEAVGSKLVIGKVVRAISNDDGSICGVKLDDGTTVDADALVVACGPWTDAARNWFGTEAGSKMPRMSGVKVGSAIAFCICLEMPSLIRHGSRCLLMTWVLWRCAVSQHSHPIPTSLNPGRLFSRTWRSRGLSETGWRCLHNRLPGSIDDSHRNSRTRRSTTGGGE